MPEEMTRFAVCCAGMYGAVGLCSGRDNTQQQALQHQGVTGKLTAYVEELRESNLRCRSHASCSHPHWEEGTHRLELPVSNTTMNFCAGVPSPTSP